MYYCNIKCVIIGNWYIPRGRESIDQYYSNQSKRVTEIRLYVILDSRSMSTASSLDSLLLFFL